MMIQKEKLLCSRGFGIGWNIWSHSKKVRGFYIDFLNWHFRVILWPLSQN